LHNSQAYIANKSIVVNYVEEVIQERKAAIAYIYCDYKDAKTQFEVEILSSITQQLVEQISLMSSEMKTFRDKNTQKEEIQQTMSESHFLDLFVFSFRQSTSLSMF